MDSITCNSDLDATVGATTTCTAMTSEGDAPAEVSCDVTGTDADGAELATSYTASLTNEAEFSAEPTA